MMRRNSTSRRVQALSSVSIRSDEIAATEMASLEVSRDGSREGGADMRKDAHGRQQTADSREFWTCGAAKSIAFRHRKVAVTEPECGARLEPVKTGPP